MKKRTATLLCGILLSMGALALFCGNPQNPYTQPKSAIIVADSSLRSLKDSVKAFTTVPCSVSLYLPNLIDSIHVHVVRSGFDTIIAGGAVSASPYTFGFYTASPGAYQVKVVVVRSDNSVDSMIKQVTVYLLLPAVVPDSTSFHITLPVDSFIVRFTATDADSNLRFGYTWLDTAIAQTQTTPFLSLKPYQVTFFRTVKSATLLAGLHAPIVCHAYAIDADSLFSPLAACTLYVKDTTKPLIQLLSPATTDTVRALPVPIVAIVTDLDGINSVTFNGSSMTFLHGGDTAVDTVSSIDSGTTMDSIVAIDIGGNRAVLHFPLTYQGKKLYPPQIKDLSRATSEGRPFAPVFLDTCVIITDPAIVDKAAFARDSVRWEIRDSSGLLLSYDLNTHLFTIPFPADSAFYGTIRLTFKVFVTNTPTTLYDTKQPSFFVTPFNFPPVITLAADQCFRVLQTDTINLNAATTAHDPNDALSSLNWTFSKGAHFKVDSVYSRLLAKASESEGLPIGNPIIPILFFTRRIVIDAISAADTSFYGTDSLNFTVSDPGGLVATKKIYFTRTTGLCLFHL
jgi:hypothetical protein